MVLAAAKSNAGCVQADRPAVPEVAQKHSQGQQVRQAVSGSVDASTQSRRCWQRHAPKCPVPKSECLTAGGLVTGVMHEWTACTLPQATRATCWRDAQTLRGRATAVRWVLDQHQGLGERD